MERAQASPCRVKRLVVVAGAACVLAAVGAPTAAAELGLPALTESDLPVPAIADVSEVLEVPELAAGEDLTANTLAQLSAPVLETREQTSEAGPKESRAEATESLARSAAPPLSRTTETLAQTAAPLLEPVQQTQLLPATGDTLAAITGSVVTTAVETLPVLGAAAVPLLQQTRPTLDSVLETTAQPLIASDASRAVVSTPELAVLPPAPTSSDREMPTALARRGPGVPVEDSIVLPALPSVPEGSADTTAGLGGTKASPTPPSVPGPFAPGGPLSDIASVSGSVGAGALMLLLAALAAALLLAAPGLGRRLRPGLAPWPQPIPQLSLERPG